MTRFVQHHFLSAFPFGTMAVNIAGCLLIGIFYGLFERGHPLQCGHTLIPNRGLCGGFTTFSTFMNENFVLLREQNYLYFISYTALSVILGLTAIYAGHLIAKAL
ncbi:MAG: fluoride efflux transporter FluC [Butyricimonas faecalis]